MEKLRECCRVESLATLLRQIQRLQCMMAHGMLETPKIGTRFQAVTNSCPRLIVYQQLLRDTITAVFDVNYFTYHVSAILIIYIDKIIKKYNINEKISASKISGQRLKDKPRIIL